MKIGIQTITDGTNFGNRLQNYALQEVLKQYDVKTFINDSYKRESFSNFIKYYIKCILENFDKNGRKRIKAFNNFNKKYIKFSNVHTYNKLHRLDIYDKYICGSDQIWNANFKENGKANFLIFADKDKTISYAASFGSDSIPDNRKKEYTDYINHLKYVSCREEAGVKIINELTNRKDCKLVLDPTLLLSSKEWQIIMKKPKINFNNKFILCYFIGQIKEEDKKNIEKYAKENKAEIINVMDKKSPFYAIGPEEFLYLEKNALLVCTDSFHSCIFAFIFNTPFFVFKRQDKYVSMNSRIDTLLKTFSLESRIYNGKLENDKIDDLYKKSNKILEKERKKSIEYLEKALTIEESD